MCFHVPQQQRLQNLFVSATVSYTHLDVYKRQEVLYAVIGIVTVTEHILTSEEHLQLCIRTMLTNCTKSVSYTHLDVYKRQVYK